MILTNLLSLTNLLVNPSFEQGVKPWHHADYTTSKWSSVRGDAEDGCKYLKIVPESSPDLFQWGVAQNVNLTEGHQYNLSVAYRVKKSYGADCHFGLFLFEPHRSHAPVGGIGVTGNTDWAILTGGPVRATTQQQVFSVDGMCEKLSLEQVVELDNAVLIDITGY